MRRTGMVLGLVGLTLGLAACPGDDTGGTGTDGDTDATSTGMTTMPSTTSPSTSTTMATTDMTTTPMTTDMTTDVTSETSTDTDVSATGTGTTGTEDMCTPCVKENCGDAIGTCLGVEPCACWLECTAAMMDEMACAKMCEGPPPPRFEDFLECVATECTEECFGGGTGTGTTGGGMDGQYEACMDGACTDPLVCNMFLNYCSIECDGDDDACPAPASGDATPTCSMLSNTCILSCADGETCPDDLECMDVGMGQMLCGAA